MKSSYVVIYISNMVQNDNLHWQSEAAKVLSRYVKVVHICVKDEPIRCIDFLSYWRVKHTVKLLAHTLQSIRTQNFTTWRRLEILPFQHLRFIQTLNQKIDATVLKLLLPSKRTVVTTSVETATLRFIHFFNAQLVIGDIPDIFDVGDVKPYADNSDIVAANSLPILEIAQGHTKNTKLISAGYFPLQFIKKLSSKTYYKQNSKRLLVIATITWRLNFKLLFSIAQSLPDFTLEIMGPEIFDFYVNEEWEEKNQQGQKLWRKLKALPNVKYIPMVRQESIPGLAHQYTCAIIPYDTKFTISRYSHPIKIYHYFAMGLPVVSTNIESLRHYKLRSLKFAQSGKEFVSCIKEFSKKDFKREQHKQMVEIALGQTYEAKAAALQKLIFT